MRRRCAGRGGRRAGFTLVEVLVALTVLAVVTVGVHRGLVSATAGTRRAEEVVGAERVARTLLAAPLGPVAPPERRSGTMGGRGWSMSLEALALPPAETPSPAAADWTPLRVRFAVSVPGARPLEVETVRVVPRSP
ncbi:PulJ/GspJ family protein [Acuticoccus sp.]|uniref:PulJ/GspJ family protein n=1 Tax=Acuticoccus sp. TaxID=1904378 RepID=UPI003B5156B9